MIFKIFESSINIQNGGSIPPMLKHSIVYNFVKSPQMHGL